MRSWILLLVVLFVAPASLRACPLCRDAVQNTSAAEAEEQAREGRAYNNSIYLMVAMPYLLVGGLGVAIHRHLRRRAVLMDALVAKHLGGSAPCPLPSTGDVS